MFFYLPHTCMGEGIDTTNPPEDLERIVEKSFVMFISDREHLNMADLKLEYIDDFRTKILARESTKGRVRHAIHNKVDRCLNVEKRFPEPKDFCNEEFMQECCEQGETYFADTAFADNAAELKATKDIIVRIIKYVMNYEKAEWGLVDSNEEGDTNE